MKASEDRGGRRVDPDSRTFEPDADAEARLARFMTSGFGVPLHAQRDRDFVLDRLPGAPQVLVALGAAHGFKFASWFGRTLAELVLDGSTPHDIAPFALDRPSLAAPADRAAWLV